MSLVSDEAAFAFLQGAPLAILAVDSRGTIVFANGEALNLFAYPVHELVGHGVEMLIPSANRGRHGDFVRQYFNDPHARVMGVGREVRGVDRLGREFPVEIGLTPVTTEGGMFVVAAVVDISVRKNIEREVTAARLVQEAMLPKSFPHTAGCEVGGATRFAAAAGGDFLDCIAQPNGDVTLMIGDASGHGFAAALVSVAAKAYLRALYRSHADPGELLTQVNQLLLEDLAEGRFVTLFVGQLFVEHGRFRYAGAGHVGYLLSASGELKSQLASTGPPVGWLPNATYDVDEVAVEPGDLILLITDGIEECFAEDGQCFGRDRIFQYITRHRGETADVLSQGILEEVQRFSDDAQHDDMTVLIAQIR